MHKENSFLLNDWHPIAAVAETVVGKQYSTRVLGKEIRYTLTNDHLIARTENSDLPLLLTKITYGLLWVSLSENPRDVPDIPEFKEHDRRVISAGAIRIATSGLRVVENFLDMAHFRAAVRKDGRMTAQMISERALRTLFCIVDVDNDGKINEEDFIAHIRAKYPGASYQQPRCHDFQKYARHFANLGAAAERCRSRSPKRS